MSHDDDPTARLRAEIIAHGLVERDYARDRGAQYDTEGLLRHFEVLAYAAPFVIVRRRSDDVIGSLMFTHQPRVYFGWAPDQADHPTGEL